MNRALLCFIGTDIAVGRLIVFADDEPVSSACEPRESGFVLTEQFRR